MPDASPPPRPPPLCRGAGLRFAPVPGLPQAPLDIEVRPGLTLVLGGERSGKTTVLRWLAGLDAPAEGRLLRQAVPACWPDPLDAACDAEAAAAWLARAAQRWPTWSAGEADAAIASRRWRSARTWTSRWPCCPRARGESSASSKPWPAAPA
jgi:energy-coupling factor transporter ATP-binding protein EcfA2